MKITITFTQKEKEAMMHAYLLTTHEKEIADKSEKVQGDFGVTEYDKTTNTITADLKEAFILSCVHMLLSVVGLIKSFISSMDMFNTSWFSNTKTQLEGEEKPLSTEERYKMEQEKNNKE